ncbi:MAG: PEGA domain-containing protein [Patescibacteria group bacterium]|nr:PEGA domain-containing protein [Patescibacteria group bacterium]
MSKKGALILVGAVLVVGLLIFIFTGGVNKKKAAVQLSAFPRSTVYIDGREAGRTPYQNDSIASGEVSFKLIPEASFSASWERKLVLNPATETVVNWEFNQNPELESGEVLYLEKTSLRSKAGLVVGCIPNSCSVTVDGQMRGTAPLNLEEVGEGSHEILISLPGYKSREVLSKVVNGYRLVVDVRLAQDLFVENIAAEEERPVSEEGKPASEPERPYVLIKETPTGWLRVRMEPSINATEAAKIDPGEKFPLLDEESGWYKILYQEKKEGWISGLYAEKFE